MPGQLASNMKADRAISITGFIFCALAVVADELINSSKLSHVIFSIGFVLMVIGICIGVFGVWSGKKDK